METKSVLYMVASVVLIIFILSAKEVAIEFIKSTVEPVPAMPFPSMFMMPPGGGTQQAFPFRGKDFAQTTL